ncbi:hypothetical protein ABUV19_28840, partial [Escherichia coli]|uniref:hypothetical protein n=1 Tax=Escherichia coli TaxID=562 RepID=UPI00336AEB74
PLSFLKELFRVLLRWYVSDCVRVIQSWQMLVAGILQKRGDFNKKHFNSVLCKGIKSRFMPFFSLFKALFANV